MLTNNWILNKKELPVGQPEIRDTSDNIRRVSNSISVILFLLSEYFRGTILLRRKTYSMNLEIW